MERIRLELKLFREKLMEIMGSYKPADRVYQVNFQMFPVSKFFKRRKREIREE
jgi:hypothetical protein